MCSEIWIFASHYLLNCISVNILSILLIKWIGLLLGAVLETPICAIETQLQEKKTTNKKYLITIKNLNVKHFKNTKEYLFLYNSN